MIGKIALTIIILNMITFCMDICRGDSLGALKDFNIVGSWVVVMLLDRQARKMK